MRKYIKYVGILLWTLFRKYFGLIWFWVALPFRKYARSVVYNYVLQNSVYLKRLLERPIIPIMGGGWVIRPYHGSEGGYVEYRKVSWLEYKLVYWVIWGWLDDDSNQDTYAKGYNKTLFSGERMKWLPSFITKRLEAEYDKDVVFGNSFDLGDRRGENAAFEFWSSYLWTIRNTAYNFKYMQWETDNVDDVFLIEKFGVKFGWEKDTGHTGVINGRQNYRLVFTKA